MNEDTINFLNNVDFENSDIVYETVASLYEENQQLKEQLEASEKARKEAIELKHKFHKDFGLLIFESYELIKFMNKLEDILNIDKGE